MIMMMAMMKTVTTMIYDNKGDNKKDLQQHSKVLF